MNWVVTRKKKNNRSSLVLQTWRTQFGACKRSYRNRRTKRSMASKKTFRSSSESRKKNYPPGVPSRMLTDRKWNEGKFCKPSKERTTWYVKWVTDARREIGKGRRGSTSKRFASLCFGRRTMNALVEPNCSSSERTTTVGIVISRIAEIVKSQYTKKNRKRKDEWLWSVVTGDITSLTFAPLNLNFDIFFKPPPPPPSR